MPGFIKMEMEDRLAIVTVNRPDALNALNSTVLRELSMAIEHLSMAADVGAIILTGAGDRAFVAGADIKEMANLSGLEMQRFSEMGRRLGDAMAACNKPIIAAINGFALGGGCELALACDIRIASVRAELGQPEVNIGIIPGFGGSQRLPRLVGPGWAAEMIYTGDRIDAATAERIGLVNRVVRSWGTVRRGVPFGRIRGPYLRVARTVPRTRAMRREPRETDSHRGSPPKLYLAHTLWSAPSN